MLIQNILKDCCTWIMRGSLSSRASPVKLCKPLAIECNCGMSRSIICHNEYSVMNRYSVCCMVECTETSHGERHSRTTRARHPDSSMQASHTLLRCMHGCVRVRAYWSLRWTPSRPPPTTWRNSMFRSNGWSVMHDRWGEPHCGGCIVVFNSVTAVPR